MARKLTAKNAKTVMDRILAMDPADRKVVLDAMNTSLNDLLDMDFFGTEGQNDPRGDHRNDR